MIHKKELLRSLWVKASGAPKKAPLSETAAKPPRPKPVLNLKPGLLM